MGALVCVQVCAKVELAKANQLQRLAVFRHMSLTNFMAHLATVGFVAKSPFFSKASYRILIGVRGYRFGQEIENRRPSSSGRQVAQAA
jgi:hypothetical protein